ncbi:G-alpha-domain-containing protein [Mucidula mucida]|nr:G-alpha-domain-containing protein [Mucidula mucida]
MPAKSPYKSEAFYYPTEKDPFVVVPPEHETVEQREARVSADKAAQKISDAIDDDIDRQRMAEKRRPRQSKVSHCILGERLCSNQNIADFQLINSPKAFREERASWRAVIQLNLARSVLCILQVIDKAKKFQDASPGSDVQSSSDEEREQDYPKMTPEHLKLRMRLTPLTAVQEALMRKLFPTNLDYEMTAQVDLASFPFRDPCVHTTWQWKGKFGRMVAPDRSSFDSAQAIDFDDPQDPGVILHNCSSDMVRLWTDPVIQELLRVSRLQLYDTSGFFLDSIERVTALKYVPTDDDILRARIKTMGVSEHRFRLKAGNMVSHDWRIFDVGGARSQVPAWVPYFDHMDAIIFLAPLNVFDQTLEEAPLVNRLEDSMGIFKHIVSSPLLKNTDIILFLNKCDLLQKKLNAGVRFNKYVVSYGEKPNTFEGTSTYLRKKFLGIFKANSVAQRPFYCHYTSVTDMKSTTHILENGMSVVVCSIF